MSSGVLTKSANTIGSTGSKEWCVLLECASSNPSHSRLSELLRQSVNNARLEVLAQSHGMFPLLIARLQDIHHFDEAAEIREELREQRRAQAALALALTAELFALQERFAKAKLEFIATKGPVLSQRCYGDPGMRQYSDLDLIVFDKDIACVAEVMVASGYESRISLQAIRAAKIPGEYVFRRPDTNLLVEFHTERTFRYHPRGLRLENLFARQVHVELDGHTIPTLCPEDELTLICIHSAKHCWEQLSWVADVAGLVTRPPGINWDRALACSREVGAERMLRVGLRLASQMLGLTLPAAMQRDIDSDPTAIRLAAQIERRMPSADSNDLGLFQRALFRMRMRGGFFRGAAYLARLSLSPTEQDWAHGADEKRPWLVEAIGRPFRLARKYGKPAKTKLQN
jgi:Uncharacterised nucleotidyltransferase